MPGPLKSCLAGWLMLGLSLFGPLLAHAQFLFEYKGYLKELGQWSSSNDLKTHRFDNIVHHRLETKWSLAPSLYLRADVRNRWMSGYTVRKYPDYADLLDSDPGWIDLSHTWLDTRRHIVHSNIDRLHVTWSPQHWEVSVGRQRINWGKTMVWNPNDLFNTYAWLDFDYEERPGTDAIRISYSQGIASGVELAFKPGRHRPQNVFAGMWKTHWGTYDLQSVVAYYREQWVLGGAWSGYIHDSGFKGEISWFERSSSISATLGLDHMFEDGLFINTEFLYNGGYQKGDSPAGAFIAPGGPDNLFISKTAWFFNAALSPHPLVSVNAGVMGSFNREVRILIPQVNYSVTENLDALLLVQHYRGSLSRSTVETPNQVFLRLKWSY